MDYDLGVSLGLKILGVNTTFRRSEIYKKKWGTNLILSICVFSFCRITFVAMKYESTIFIWLHLRSHTSRLTIITSELDLHVALINHFPPIKNPNRIFKFGVERGFDTSQKSVLDCWGKAKGILNANYSIYFKVLIWFQVDSKMFSQKGEFHIWEDWRRVSRVENFGNLLFLFFSYILIVRRWDFNVER